MKQPLFDIVKDSDAKPASPDPFWKQPFPFVQLSAIVVQLMTAKVFDEFFSGSKSSGRQVLQGAGMSIAFGNVVTSGTGILYLTLRAIQLVISDYNLWLAIVDVPREVLVALVSDPLLFSSKSIMLTESAGPFHPVLRMRSYLRCYMSRRRLYAPNAATSTVGQGTWRIVPDVSRSH